MTTVLILVVIYLSFISLGLPDSLLGSAWPAIYESLAVPLHYAGFISMIIAGGTVISSVGSERIIRRWGTGLVTALSILMTATALMGFSFSQHFLLLCLCAVPLGLGAGSVDAALNNYVALHYKAKHMNWLHCFWGVGASLGPFIIAAFLIRLNSWHLGYRTIGIVQCFLVVILFVAVPLWRKDTAAGTERQKKSDGSLKIPALLHRAGVKEVLSAFFCYCTLEAITGLWGSTYLVTVKNIPAQKAAQVIALYFMGITIGRFIAGLASMRLNNRQMIRGGQCLIAGGILLLIVPINGAALAVSGFFIIGLGCAPVFPSLLHETPRNFGKEYAQAVMGIQMASAYIGTTLMPPLFGRIAVSTGFSLFPFFIGLVLLLKIFMVERAYKKIDSAHRAAKNLVQSSTNSIVK
ncbi:MAG: MFS transporter [Spirochaetaceae bacterium]|jgi:fucose permease|nr:MFS transporter [Spirochaetaceae bacterium]